ncbi:hypothetical protein AVEN_219433-1 [Araneus ventricosus]|uniref:Uncharacterized protein n=1 Tax=Araneus ventricosus TaxID=182803 RepID=A0A4Y2TDD1_ARAVE|nr:hypothetical protein AVEN_36085-1 [Araneus ventricosus]GBN97409.1 hypothetical protein AVEN_219433-1 [Araneus ventricosus]
MLEVKRIKFIPPIRIHELDARVAARQRICLHWHLAWRLEMKLEITRVWEEESGWQEFCDFELRLKRNFGTFVNALPNFLTKMSGKKSNFRTSGILVTSLLVNA